MNIVKPMQYPMRIARACLFQFERRPGAKIRDNTVTSSSKGFYFGLPLSVSHGKVNVKNELGFDKHFVLANQFSCLRKLKRPCIEKRC